MHLYGTDDLARGAWVDGWVIERKVARGSMSDVYRATGPSGLPAALKVLRQQYVHDRVALERFGVEARALGAVKHPAVPVLLASGTLPSGLPYLALEWLEGRTLAARVAEDGPLGLDEATRVLEVVCSAVAATHAAGLVHRDLKAENVFCLEGGGFKLLDYGIARQLEDRGAPLTSTGHVIGTPIALAPEQLRQGQTSPETDVYALGVLLHVVLAGRPPFDAAALVDLEAQHLHAPPPPLSARARVPPALDAVAARCLAKDPRARWAGPLALLDAWRAALDRPDDVMAVGISVELSLPDGAPDAEWEALERLEREAVLRLERAGFQLASDSVLLLATRLEHAAATDLSARWRAFAAALKAELVPFAKVAVHVSPARVEAGRLVDSDVLRPLEWPEESRLP